VVASDASSVDALISSRQLVTAIVPDWASTTAELRLWERDGAGWKLAMGPWPGVVGTSGTAWGVGLHGAGAPGRGGPVKREGDGKSPAGAFALRSAYGYAPAAKAGIPYQPVDASWKCVDDPKSTRYTQIFDQREMKKDWSSAEDMRRSDELYKWVVDVAHNPSASAGAGSCIFLHVWRGPSSATVGCTAMDENTLAQLIEALHPGATFVLLPREDYDALAPVWGLPRY
jgi:D-alanyl-D-alanine dipeptidase